MLLALGSLTIAALLAVPLCRHAGRLAVWALAAVPAGCTVWLLGRVPTVAAGNFPVRAIGNWAELGFEPTLRLDGLALLFALLICGLGTLVVLHGGGYFRGRSPDAASRRGRFLAMLFAFMVSMLGLVLADDVLTLFLFWEGTAITSYLLIGFDPSRERSRKAAQTALLVTAIGGLALLAGLLLLAGATGTSLLSEIVAAGTLVHPHASAITVLVLLGALTKSAQFPFHFWLPGAMTAPTPASAYLHSATMVKAGVFLLARLQPALGEGLLWLVGLGTSGTITMLLGAILAVRQTDLKRLLAFTTLSVLGTLVLLLALGATPAAESALVAAMVLVVAHALYKGCLFLVAGTVDLQTGTRDVARLAGLGRTMPWTAAAALAAALSMAGLPPLLGFLAKEKILAAKLGAPVSTLLFTTALAAAVFGVAAALLVGWRPFFRRSSEASTASGGAATEGAIELVAGPLLLGGLGLVLGTWPALAGPVVGAAAGATLGAPLDLQLKLWHGFDPLLLASLAVLVAGIALYRALSRSLDVAPPSGAPSRPLADLLENGFDRLWDRSLSSLFRLASSVDHGLQRRPLSVHLRLAVFATALGVGGFLAFGPGRLALAGNGTPSLAPIGILETTLVALGIAGALTAAASSARLVAVAGLGAVGLVVALLFLHFGAPDLAMTQLAVETLTVVLVVLAFRRLPALRKVSSAARVRLDAALALVGGAVMAALVFASTQVRLGERISDRFLEWSVPEGHGRNVVNVILVDFRALDTLGEIVVLAVAAAGAVALLRGGRAPEEAPR